MTDIVQRVLKHIDVYENSGEVVPPFRMTYEELLQHNEWIAVNGSFIPGVNKYTPMAEYYGVDIELVALLTPNKKRE